MERAQSPFTLIKQHVLLPYASQLAQVDGPMAARLTPEAIAAVVAQVPDSWLTDEPLFSGPAAQRRAYVDYFVRRLQAPRAFVEEAIRAHATHL
jgi:hypothetical protein